MSTSKALLKSAREKLNKKDFSGAKDAAERVLDYEAGNYMAHIFIALSWLELGDHEQSEKVYQSAIKLDPEQVLGRQGLAKFYERTEAWEKLASCLGDLADAYRRAHDAVKLAETLQRLLEVRRNHGTNYQIVETLLLFLPGSPYYTVFLTLPEPDPTNPTASTTYQTQCVIQDSLPTLEEVVGILEAEESAKHTKEFNARRTRLGAPKPDVIRRDLDREICESSRLPELYNEILNHPKTDDELRLSTDAKLLRYQQRHLFAVPASDQVTKARLLKGLEELVQGAILLRRPDETAWGIYLDWLDYVDVDQVEPRTLGSFVELFPKNSLSEVLRAYFLFRNVRVLEGGEEDGEGPDSGEVGLDALLNCPVAESNTILAYRILGDAYLTIEDYENASSIARKGLQKLGEVESASGKTLQKTRLGLQVILLTSLVHLFPPKYHVQATPLIDQVLAIDPKNVKTLMAKGFVLQARKGWREAKGCFDLVVGLAGDEALVVRAQEESAWCESLADKEGVRSAISSLKEVYKGLEALGVENELDMARCLWRIGQCYWNLGGADRGEAFGNFIAALKKDPSYAAAFTSLGLYYADYASPPDPIRASKCFQKAFELDPRETVAARRLAIGFADEQEWDLVEVIAKRTIEGEGGLELAARNVKEGGEGEPRNVWAWKALGVVELQNSNFPAATTAFQVALRAKPEDGNLWLRLGEAYSKAGRYAAAVKALERAQALNEGDWLPRYFIAQAQQGIGLYDEAIAAYKALAAENPAELGIVLSLAQAYMQLGVAELNTGFRSRAETSFLSVAELALGVIDNHPGFRAVAWKLVTDATYNLSRLSSFESERGVKGVVASVKGLLPAVVSEDEVLRVVLEGAVGDVRLSQEVLAVAIRSAEYRIGLGSSNTPEHTSWYDLGVSLQLWGIRHPKEEKVGPLVVKYLSKAVKQDPLNDRYWAALGLAYLTSSPRAAQHALVKALEIDGKNAGTWAVLGMLYLQHGDVELAEQVFLRTQTLDPDCAGAWIGQALIADGRGEKVHADALFLHATSLDEVVPAADYNTSLRIFENLQTPGQVATTSLDGLLPSYYLLARYCSRRPNNAAGLHLYALVCERLGHVAFGRSLVQRAIEILERVYEDTEDSLVERQFMIANATLGRLNLICGDPDASLPSFESVLALVQEDDASKSVLETQARMGIGMAQLLQGDYYSAVATFQEAQRLAEGSGVGALRGQATITLAQVLWALGEGAEAADGDAVVGREAGKTELLKCIAEDPNDLAAIKTLAGMGILSGDEGLVDAAVSEIVGLPPDQRVQLDSERNVDQLLIQYHLSRNELSQALLLAEKSVFYRPSDSDSRNSLAALLLKADNPERALAVLKENGVSGSGFGGGVAKAERGSQPRTLILEALAYARLGVLGNAKRCAQKAVMLRPTDVGGWKVLAQVRQLEGQSPA